MAKINQVDMLISLAVAVRNNNKKMIKLLDDIFYKVMRKEMVINAYCATINISRQDKKQITLFVKKNKGADHHEKTKIKPSGRSRAPELPLAR